MGFPGLCGSDVDIGDPDLRQSGRRASSPCPGSGEAAPGGDVSGLLGKISKSGQRAERRWGAELRPGVAMTGLWVFSPTPVRPPHTGLCRGDEPTGTPGTLRCPGRERLYRGPSRPLPISHGGGGHLLQPPSGWLSGRRAEAAGCWPRQSNLQVGRVGFSANSPLPGFLGKLRQHAESRQGQVSK